MQLVQESIRAAVTVGNVTISTPWVKSFNVQKTRGKLTATFTASIELDGTTITANAGEINSKVVIQTAVNGVWRKIFTGFLKKVNIGPAFEHAGWFNITLSGDDSMFLLEGRKFSRRLQITTLPEYAVITSRLTPSVTAPQRYLQTNIYRFDLTSGMAKIITAPDIGGTKFGGAEPPKVRAFQKGAMVIHDHSSNDQWGPAYGTYKSDDEAGTPSK